MKTSNKPVRRYSLLVTRYSLIILCVFLCYLLFACNTKRYTPKKYTALNFFGTEVTALICPDGVEGDFNAKADAAWAEIRRSFDELDFIFSTEREGGDVWRFNNSEGGEVEVSYTLFDNLRFLKNLESYAQSGVYDFDPTIGLLTDLWGFSANSEPLTEVPSNEKIEAFKNLCGLDKLDLRDDGYIGIRNLDLRKDNGKHIIVKPFNFVTFGEKKYTMQLDFGGLVKGIAADLAYEILNAHGFKRGYVSVGRSSICVVGEWDVELTSPVDPEKTYARVKVKDGFITTSGNYERYYEIGGVRYCHIIDPKTGRPINNEILSVTVFCSHDAIKGREQDMFTTVFMVGGNVNSIENMPFVKIAAVVKTADEKPRVLTNYEELVLLDKNFVYEK